MAAIFYGSSRPTLPGPLADRTVWGDLLRGAVHVTEYAILAVLTYRAAVVSAARRHVATANSAPCSHRSPDARLLISVLTIAAGYALFDELHQSFVPGRCFSLVDLALDIAGAALGLGLMTRFAELVGQASGGQRGSFRR